jgi:hypothetical protein
MSNSDKTIVYCIQCDQPIYELVKPIFLHDVAEAKDFKSLEPDAYGNPQNFEMMNCPKCGEFFPQKHPLLIKTNKGMMPNAVA